MKEFFKKIKWVSLFDALVSVVFGALMVFCTDFSKSTIVYLFASLILVAGVVKIANYFMFGIEPFGFVLGITNIALAIVIFSAAEAIVDSSILGVLFGIVLIVKSLFSIQDSFDMRRLGSKWWWVDTILATAVLVFAITVVANPENEAILFVLLGVSLILDGILSAVDVFVVSAEVKKTRKKIADMFKVDNNTTIEM